jgi:hypothetical protein
MFISLYQQNPTTSLSHISNKGQKYKKNKILYQNSIEKISRDIKYIFFKV